MRLQKYLARAGVASRRACESLILDGRVRVNGKAVCELGTKVDECDIVELDGKHVTLPLGNVTIMLNKPAGYVTTMSDKHGRPTVAQLIPLKDYPSLFPVGRLDMDTTGLLLFTTDGELGNKLLHPKFHVDKTYIAEVQGSPTEEEISTLCNGVLLEDGRCAPAKVRVLGRDGNSSGSSVSKLEITIHEGRKRQVRRMFESIGHKVIRLHRISLGSLKLGNLESGKWRLLSDEEITELCPAYLQ